MSSCPSHGLMPIAQAQTRLEQAGRHQLLPVETISIYEALDRILAEDVIATLDVPPQANSAMDGYAVCCDKFCTQQPYVVSQRITAGVAPQPLLDGTVARIFTGAVIPEGANAVIMQEDAVVAADGTVSFVIQPDAYDNIRPQGQDIRQGTRILSQGTRLSPAAIGLLATIGHAKVNVYRRLKVMFFCTGNELVEPSQPLASGQIYNSNRALLASLLKKLDIDLIDGGVIPDNLEATLDALQQATQQADVIMTTGGVSVGEEDHVKAAVNQCGRLELWKIAIKPGKPLAFGYVHETPFLGLPGNPQSVFVTFAILARIFLINYQGQRDGLTPQFALIASDFAIKKAQTRTEYLRVKVVHGSDGLRLIKHDNQSSGVLSSAVWADGFAVIPAGQIVSQGDLLAFLSFSSLLLA
ncbi:gephyrin-like molybdotransferase Glp [Agitococcus lubricus]|uniref:Molybdopterin molybdenumtransferase n=1 Tax=Agitococcus lubricus TaxID=1077255 RepID=A0A2T5IVH1_9GAMM|nr:gephyrin-like molybdotransferase Glp [Agitococcus lubricus]PTQ87863.1 molybdopterin molybdochelatase [Agitococcus lubricus]